MSESEVGESFMVENTWAAQITTMNTYNLWSEDYDGKCGNNIERVH